MTTTTEVPQSKSLVELLDELLVIPGTTTTDSETIDGRDSERRRRAAEFGEF